STFDVLTCDESKPSPTMNQTIKPTIDAGIVVHSICLICLYKSVSTTNAAKFVVSERGESLSPNIAPDIIAPAAMPSGMFNSTAIPISATPAVADDPHAVPVATDTTAAIKNAITKK